MTVKVEAITESRVLGEGPHWDHERQHLYYVDAFRPAIHRYIPSENRDTCCVIEGPPVSIIIPIKGKSDKFLVAAGKNVAIVTWDGESTKPQNLEILHTVDTEKGKENCRLNDGKVDPTGLLWIGSLAHDPKTQQFEPGKGSLYAFPKGGKPIKHVEGLTIANGLAWSSDLKKMYYADTPTKRVDVFDYDAKNGKISNRRTLTDLSNVEGHGPDGLCIDTNGNLWVANFGAAGVFNIDGNTGEIIRKIDIPSLQTTSVCFGGPNLDELFVVSAKYQYTEEEEKKYPKGGCTFRVTGLGVKGYPGMPVDI